MIITVMTTPTQQKLDQALSFSQYQATLNQQRRVLKEKFHNDCIIGYNGGLFKITQEWLAGFDKSFDWVLDMNQMPVQVSDTDALYDIAKAAYQSALTNYGTEFQQLRKKRNVKSMTDV